jgi:3-oxoacyl-[acyl-carrier protein] reductase
MKVDNPKVVVVTGGASGIGNACVREFIAAGWNVIINYFCDQELAAAEDLRRLAELAGLKAVCVQGDVTARADCRRIAALAERSFGRLDGLVNSAGTTRIVPHTDLDALTMEDFLQTCAVNTVGPFQMTRACAPLLAEGEGGAVVIISSYGAIFGTGSSIAYAASKGAANTLTMSLARVLAPKIRVNAVCPALTEHGFVQRLDPVLFEARRARQVERAPLRSVAQPEDIAKDIVWLVAGAKLMTGHIFMQDSGLHLNGDG